MMDTARMEVGVVVEVAVVVEGTAGLEEVEVEGEGEVVIEEKVVVVVMEEADGDSCLFLMISKICISTVSIIA